MFSVNVFAQQDALPQANVHTSLALPFNELLVQSPSLEHDVEAFGFGAGFMVPLSDNSPLKIGASFTYMWMGGKKKRF